MTPRALEKYLPLSYLALAFALIAALLPTALRPPQDQPTTQAEFSPDAPPDESPENKILGELARAQTGTAGAGEGTGEGDGALEGPPATVDPEAPARFCPRGIGDPPRQDHSFYSPACAPAFVGSNPGATYQGVSSTEVRIAAALGSALQTSYEGPVPHQREDGENAADRTYRVLQQYFNETFQLYGRTLQIIAQKPGSGEASHRSYAAEADEEHRVFGGLIVGAGMMDEYARRGMPALTNNQVPERWLHQSAPYMWAWWMDATKASRFGAEYMCKKLHGEPAEFAGDPVLRGQERVFGGVFYDDSFVYQGVADDFEQALADECGIELAETIRVNLTEDGGRANYGTAVARLRMAGVTTVVYAVDFVASGPALTATADAQGYYPEWFVPGIGGVDRNVNGRLQHPNQWQNAFGITGLEMERPAGEQDCYRAYKSIEPSTEPNASVCLYVYPLLHQLVTGMQLAGPELNPQTLERGLFEQGRRFYEEPVWAVGGGYGPGDYTYTDNVAEIWWDPTAISPVDGSRGAYQYVRGGQRDRLGELPREDPLVFSDGTTTPG